MREEELSREDVTTGSPPVTAAEEGSTKAVTTTTAASKENHSLQSERQDINVNSVVSKRENLTDEEKAKFKAEVEKDDRKKNSR